MDMLHAASRAIEAANRPDASQADLDSLGQLFDQVSILISASALFKTMFQF